MGNIISIAHGKHNMPFRRALMTKRERELIAGDDDDDLRYQAVSRVRRKINDELTTDAEILREDHPDLYEELREVVCEPEGNSASSGGE
jgi:hypothetical protein